MTGPDEGDDPTGAAGLERRYWRLLGWYPRRFRAERGEEMLAVLMASAADGQRRPRLKETANVITSALGMRVRVVRSWVPNPGWGDALAMFSLAAPLFLLVIDVLEVVLPYRPPTGKEVSSSPIAFQAAQQIGWLSLASQHGFQIAVGGQVIIAVLVLLGWRRLALAAIAAAAVYWYVAAYWIPAPLQLFSTGVYLLGAAALIASPGPRRGRHLMHWGHGVALLLIAGAVQVSTIRYDMLTGPDSFLQGPSPTFTTPYIAISVALAVIAAGLMAVFKLNRYFLLLLAALLYPYVMELAFIPGSSSSDLIGSPTLVHLIVLYLPPLLLAGPAVLAAVRLRARGGQPARA